MPEKSYFLFFQRAITALRPSSDLPFAESFAMRAGPPLSPPSLPKATAAGFFFLAVDLRESLGIAECLLSRDVSQCKSMVTVPKNWERDNVSWKCVCE